MVCPLILYVNVLATGNGDGSTWADAYTNLADAMDYARNNTACVNEIWVAAGTYYALPGSGAGNNGTSINLIDGMRIYGGFPNTGNPVFADRDWQAHPTVLHGDYQQDGAYGNNTFTFFRSPTSLGNTTLLDGFEMRQLRGRVISLALAGGTSTATFRNLRIVSCELGIEYTTSSMTALQWQNMTIENSQGSNQHAISIVGSSGNDNSLFSNCIVRNNALAGVLVASGGANLTPTFLNCEFSTNNSGTGGGVVQCNTSNFGSGAAPEFVNCLLHCCRTSGSSRTLVQQMAVLQLTLTMVALAPQHFTTVPCTATPQAALAVPSSTGLAILAPKPFTCTTALCGTTLLVGWAM